MNVGVYCSSSDRIAQTFFEVADDAGQRLAAGGHTLVYGGGNVGLMGALARSVHRNGGQVVGVIPEALKAREGVAYDIADELITTRTMQQRKALIFTRADAFLALPGGPGTLEEFMEVLTLRQLGYHDKPIALVNTGGFYEPLLSLLGHYVREGFARESLLRLFHAAPDPAEALEHVTRQADSS